MKVLDSFSSHRSESVDELAVRVRENERRDFQTLMAFHRASIGRTGHRPLAPPASHTPRRHTGGRPAAVDARQFAGLHQRVDSYTATYQAMATRAWQRF